MTPEKFDDLYSKLTRREGWVISNTLSECSPWQIQRIDMPEDGEPYLNSDDVAWQIVMTGTGPHHKAVRQVIQEHSPEEWRLISHFAATNNLNVPGD